MTNDMEPARAEAEPGPHTGMGGTRRSEAQQGSGAGGSQSASELPDLSRVRRSRPAPARSGRAPRNAGSLRILHQLGFRDEGYLRERYRVGDECQNAVVLGLLRREWQALAGGGAP